MKKEENEENGMDEQIEAPQGLDENATEQENTEANENDGETVEDEEHVEPWRKDARLLYIRTMMEKLANMKTDLWIRMIDKCENREPIFEFLDNVEHRKLLFVKIGTGYFPSLNGFPNAEISKGKFIYFLRKSDRMEITEKNVNSVLLTGTGSDNSIQNFSVYTNNAIVPLLMNPKNQANWPQVLKDEMQKKLQDLRNSITEALGAINERTVFPLPVTLSALMQIASNIFNDNDLSQLTPAMKESIEQIVLRWSRLVNAYVARSSYDIFKINKYATPDDEMDFWRARLDNLKNTFYQLRTNEIKTIALILEKSGSVYVNQMKRILSSIAAAYEEAYDIDLYLKPLQTILDKMRSTEFSNARHFIAPLMHTIVLIWSNSKHLSSNQRIVHLFKLIYHKIFEFINDDLNPTSIFAGDVADTLEKVEKTLSNLNHYKEIHEQYRANLSSYQPVAKNAEQWSFDPQEIFQNFDLFVDRIIKTNEMLKLLFELKKMEDTVFGGHTGKRVTKSVMQIADSVSILTDVLKDISFNVFDLDETENFEHLTVKFNSQVADLQQQLAKQYGMSLHECNSITKFIKLIVNLANTLHLPIVYDELSPKFVLIAQMLEHEVINVEKVFETYSSKYALKALKEVIDLFLHKLFIFSVQY